MYRLVLLIIITCCFFTHAFSQQFGGHPPSVKWKQVNSDTSRIIFPAGLDSAAMRAATVVNALDRYTQQTIGNRRQKINIVLQPSTIIPNAYVALGPFRSEFQLTPPQNSFELGSLPWVDNLAIHEYRHVQQYNNFNRGLSKAFRVLFGQEGQALANALTVPDWFFEGDAVYNETKVSRQGRGRLPNFFNDYRSLWQAGKDYSWMKLRNGSLRDFVPDHYKLGYILTAYGYEKYGNAFWKNVSGDAASFKGVFYPWQKAIQKYAGIPYRQFRTDALAYFRNQSPITQGMHKTDAPGRGHFLGNQEHPYFMSDEDVVYMETRYDRIPRFMVEHNGELKKLRARDISIDNYFSYRNGKIVYAAYRPDVRWGWRDYSELKLLDASTGKQRSLTKRTKYFSPDISEDGNTVVAVEVSEKGSSALHLLNAGNGNVERVVPNPDRVFYTYPKFYKQQQVVSAVRSTEGKMSLAIVDLQTGANKYLLPFGWNVIGFPWIEADTIYFTASAGRTDRLYGWANDNFFLMDDDTLHETGNYQLNTRNGRAVWTSFYQNGMRLQRGRVAARRAAESVLTPNATFQVSSIETDTSNLLTQLPPRSFNVQAYPKSFQLFNFHSRRPYISDPDYSFSFVSQNVINTLQSELFFNYNRNEEYKQLGFSVLYGGLFPVLRMGVNYTIDRRAAVSNRTQLAFWDEAEARVGFSIPLNLTAGRTFTSLSISSDYVHNKRFFKGYFKDSFDNRSFGYLSNTISFSNQIQQARQHIYPRLAQTLLLNYRRAVTNLEGNQLLASGSLYLPGVSHNHSFVLQAAFQRRDTLRNVSFSNSFPFSRGYAVFNFHRMWKVGGNYHFPLVYPDWGFGSLVYFLRIRANAFYDFTRIADYNRDRVLVNLDFRSYGAEIFFDTKWWNQLPLSFGIRYSRLMDRDVEGRGPNQWEFILPINLLGR
jgi:hypothetical protein